jgi:hypothetical protein
MQVGDVGRETKEKRRRYEEEVNAVYERKMCRVKHARKECQNMKSKRPKNASWMKMKRGIIKQKRN